MIKGKLIYLLPLQNEDIDFMLEMANDQEITFWEAKNEFLISEFKQREWFKNNLNNGLRYIIYEIGSNQKVGYFSFKMTNEVSKTGKIALKFVKESRGKNFGTDVLKLMMSFLFNKMNMHRLFTSIVAYNKSSLKLFEKCGWLVEGNERQSIYMNKTYHDNYSISILRAEYELLEDDDYKNRFNFS
ncbi:MAG: hypothetical protein COS42_00935 [Flavobacteriales bacterium CG03_land_8_20_14_0_80_35_15]|nr:GNAT family N-acetyltransferase [Flavobacteriia bacterium]PIV18998.1 MAG: hypothetical protein COS42_00935 [Flavobacteriales bacterium CG03_land_8_20_14_0_80_35_15]PJA05084.1 MAG: hypothetical protein COX71_08510 [Flavobacteriales bacterium CG_4_10_14_0_2_um_filter_35_18]